jgi:hypothetical protein
LKRREVVGIEAWMCDGISIQLVDDEFDERPEE